MRKIGLIFGAFVLFLCCASGIAQQADTTAWYKHAGYTGVDQGNGLAVDNNGAVIVAGQFERTLAMNPLTVTSRGRSDIFIAKYSAAGEIQFLSRAGGPGNDRAYDVATDSDGNIIIAGALDGDGVDFGHVTLSSNGGNDAFVAKYNGSGDLLWARNFGDQFYDQAYEVTVDEEDNIVITGWFYGELAFDAETLNSGGESDAFIAKLSPDGSTLWARQGMGNAADLGYGVACGENGEVFACGIFRGEISFNDLSLTSNGLTDMFIVKYDRDGELVWGKNFGGEASDRAYALAFDQTNGVVGLAGYHEGRGSFNDAPERVFESPNGDRNIFIASMDRDGNLLWGRSEGSPLDDQGRGIAIDDEGFFYVTGAFASVATIAESSMKSSGTLDVFLAKYTKTGHPVWADHVGGGPDLDWGLDIEPDASGNAIVAGHFKKTAFFGGNRFISRGNQDIFLAKVAQPFNLGGVKLSAPKQHFIDSEFSLDIKFDQADNIHEIEVDVTFSNLNDVFAVEDSVFPEKYFGDNPEFSYSVDNAAGKIHLRAKKRRKGGDKNAAFARIVFNTRRSTPFEARSDFHVENIFARDELGRYVFLRMDQVDVQFVGVSVWPGDANNDGQVNERDILPIGQYFDSEGPARASASGDWEPQKVVPWKPPAASYADANGDGVVNQEDLLPIGLNWMKVWDNQTTAAKRRGVSRHGFVQSSGTGDIGMQAANLDTTTDAVWIEVAVDSVEDLYGLSFEVHYPQNGFTDALQIDVGPMFDDPIFFSNNNEDEGVIGVAMTQKGTPVGVFGEGVVTRILFALNGVSSEELLDSLRMEGVTGNDSEGRTIEFRLKQRGVVTSIADDENSSILPESFHLYQNMPNPFNPETRIRFSLAQAGNVQLLIYNEFGQLVRALVDEFRGPGQHSVNWDGRDSRGTQVATGIYFYLLRSEQTSQTRKMLLIR